ncbi:MAG: SseB family protein [Microbacteriaceae bacterium]|nr:SseB family protein [Microbacteriaceae bacterium]
MTHDHHTDSAGVPWEGRSFQPNPHAGDSGETPPEVASATVAWRSGTGTYSALIAAFATNRFLIPLVAHAGDDFDADNPVMEDKVQELSVVTVAGPNAEKVIPVFTSASAMKVWNAGARPIPIDAQRVALAAASESTDRIVVNPGTDSVVIRRPALWAMAQGVDYRAPWESTEFLAETRSLLAGVANLDGVTVNAADPLSTGDGADVSVNLSMSAGLDHLSIRAVLAAVQQEIAEDDNFRRNVDALVLTVVVSST